MLPNVLRTNAADHVPVLADEVRELLAVQPGETVVDATFGAGGHSRLLAEDLQGSGKLVAIDRDPTVRPYFDRLKAAARGVQTRFLRGDYAVVLGAARGERRARRTRAARPRRSRRCRSTGPSAGSRTRPTRRSTCGWTPPTSRARRTIVATWDERELATMFRRYGEERYARQIARGIVRRRAEQPDRAHRRSSSTSSGRRSRRRRASARGIRRSACSRRCASR